MTGNVTLRIPPRLTSIASPTRTLSARLTQQTSSASSFPSINPELTSLRTAPFPPRPAPASHQPTSTIPLPALAHAAIAPGIMTGRTRRASTSSVDTVDEPAVQWRQEASVLRSVPKSEPNDNWPIFQLRDAIVLNRDGTTVENALHIVPNGPFIVRGNLHFTSDEKRFGASARPSNTSTRPSLLTTRCFQFSCADDHPSPSKSDIASCTLSAKRKMVARRSGSRAAPAGSSSARVPPTRQPTTPCVKRRHSTTA